MEEKKIYKAISEIMGEIGHIGKEKKNQQQGFMFRGIDQVMNTMKPLLSKHGVFILPEVVDMKREERQTRGGTSLTYSILTVKHHFIADDGSEVVSTTIGEGMDSADKASNKAMAVAFKYACFQVFCIPTEEIAKDDPDNYTVDGGMRADIANMLRNLEAATSFEDLEMLVGSFTDQMKTNQQIRDCYRAARARIQSANTPK